MLDPGEAVKYRFAGGKEVQLKLVERRGKEAKVLARVGGLWQDFELFLVRYGPAPMSSSSSSSGSYGKHSSTRKRRLAD